MVRRKINMFWSEARATADTAAEGGLRSGIKCVLSGVLFGLVGVIAQPVEARQMSSNLAEDSCGFSARSIEMIIFSDIYPLLNIPIFIPIFRKKWILNRVYPFLSTSELEAVCRARARVVWWDASKELVQVQSGGRRRNSDMAPEWLKISMVSMTFPRNSMIFQ